VSQQRVEEARVVGVDQGHVYGVNNTIALPSPRTRRQLMARCSQVDWHTATVHYAVLLLDHSGVEGLGRAAAAVREHAVLEGGVVLTHFVLVTAFFWAGHAGEDTSVTRLGDLDLHRAAGAPALSTVTVPGVGGGLGRARARLARPGAVQLRIVGLSKISDVNREGARAAVTGGRPGLGRRSLDSPAALGVD